MAELSTLFALPAPEAARRLIGMTLTVGGVGGVVVETEAYEAQDPASHSFAGPTRRNAAMFGPVGAAYVYRIYGLHWCLNLVCDAHTPGSAVLIRAIAPTHDIETMVLRRGAVPRRRLCAGPGRLCRALDVTGALDGAPLDRPPFALAPTLSSPSIIVGPRIGISRNTELFWRFGLRGSDALSRPFPAAG